MNSHESEITWAPDWTWTTILLSALPFAASWGAGKGQQPLHEPVLGSKVVNWILFSPQRVVPPHSHVHSAQLWRCNDVWVLHYTRAHWNGDVRSSPWPHSIKCPLTLPFHHVKGIFLQTVTYNHSLLRAKPTLIMLFAAFLRAVAFLQHSWKAFLHSGEPFTLVSLFSQENLMGIGFMPSSQHFCRSVFWYLLAAI